MNTIPILVEEKEVISVTSTKKFVLDRYEITETYRDKKLVSQSWGVKGDFSKSHPDMYNPQSAHFAYYEDISFLNSTEPCNRSNFYDKIPKPSMITDWSEFKGFGHVLCIFLDMDGNIYRIDKPDPIPLWRRQGYIGGFDNASFDLQEVKEYLSTLDWVKNIEQINIPYYNREEGYTNAVEFEYLLPSRKHLKVLSEKFPNFRVF